MITLELSVHRQSAMYVSNFLRRVAFWRTAVWLGRQHSWGVASVVAVSWLEERCSRWHPTWSSLCETKWQGIPGTGGLAQQLRWQCDVRETCQSFARSWSTWSGSRILHWPGKYRIVMNWKHFAGLKTSLYDFRTILFTRTVSSESLLMFYPETLCCTVGIRGMLTRDLWIKVRSCFLKPR